MTKKISTFAIMACLASSLAFAGDKARAMSSVNDGKDATALTSDSATDNNSVRASAKDQDNAKAKHNAKPARSKQEQEFDKVLLSIYG